MSSWRVPAGPSTGRAVPHANAVLVALVMLVLLSTVSASPSQAQGGDGAGDRTAPRAVDIGQAKEQRGPSQSVLHDLHRMTKRMAGVSSRVAQLASVSLGGSQLQKAEDTLSLLETVERVGSLQPDPPKERPNAPLKEVAGGGSPHPAAEKDALRTSNDNPAAGRTAQTHGRVEPTNGGKFYSVAQLADHSVYHKRIKGWFGPNYRGRAHDRRAFLYYRRLRSSLCTHFDGPVCTHNMVLLKLLTRWQRIVRLQKENIQQDPWYFKKRGQSFSRINAKVYDDFYTKFRVITWQKGNFIKNSHKMVGKAEYLTLSTKNLLNSVLALKELLFKAQFQRKNTRVAMIAFYTAFERLDKKYRESRKGKNAISQWIDTVEAQHKNFRDNYTEKLSDAATRFKVWFQGCDDVIERKTFSGSDTAAAVWGVYLRSLKVSRLMRKHWGVYVNSEGLKEQTHFTTVNSIIETHRTDMIKRLKLIEGGTLRDIVFGDMLKELEAYNAQQEKQRRDIYNETLKQLTTKFFQDMEPYSFFIDNANTALHSWYTDFYARYQDWTKFKERLFRHLRADVLHRVWATKQAYKGTSYEAENEKEYGKSATLTGQHLVCRCVKGSDAAAQMRSPSIDGPDQHYKDKDSSSGLKCFCEPHNPEKQDLYKETYDAG